jgi:hypothetical protein
VERSAPFIRRPLGGCELLVVGAGSSENGERSARDADGHVDNPRVFSVPWAARF